MNCTYGFVSPPGLWKVVTSVSVFVTALFIINTFIVYKAGTKVIQVCGGVGNCWLKA